MCVHIKNMTMRSHPPPPKQKKKGRCFRLKVHTGPQHVESPGSTYKGPTNKDPKTLHQVPTHPAYTLRSRSLF